MSEVDTSASGATMAENAAPATATVEATADSDLHEGDEGSGLPEEGEDGQSESGVPKGVRKRFNTLTKQKYELVETVAQLKAELERRDAQAHASQLTEPDISNFDDYDAYVDAKAEYLAEKKLADRAAQAQQLTQQQREEQEVQKRVQAYTERAQAFRESTPDFQAAIESVPQVLLKPSVVDAILRMEDGPQVSYHLAKNVAELHRISGLPEKDQVFALFEVSRKLAQKAPVRTPAPAPAPRLNGAGAAGQKSINDMTAKEYAEFRTAQDIAAGRRRA